MLDIVRRLLEEGRLERGWLREVLWKDRRRILSGADNRKALRNGYAVIDRWLEAGEWEGDLEAVAHAHEAGRIAVELVRDRGEELPELVAAAVSESDGRLSLPGGMALLALAGGVEHRTARWQFRYLEILLRGVDREMAHGASEE